MIIFELDVNRFVPIAFKLLKDKDNLVEIGANKSI